MNTYISNHGSAKAFFLKNNKNLVNEVNWDADYDGNIAKISITTNDNGKRDKYNYNLDNSDLNELLNIETVDIPIDRRLERDFLNNRRGSELITPLIIHKKTKMQRKTRGKNNKRKRNSGSRTLKRWKRRIFGNSLF